MAGENYAEEARRTLPHGPQPHISQKRWVKVALDKAAGRDTDIKPITLKPNPLLAQLLARQGLTLEPMQASEPRPEIYEYYDRPDADES